MDLDSEEEAPPPVVVVKKEEKKRRRPKKIKVPVREPSIIVPPPKKIYITPDKTTCVECTCFPKEDPYVKPKKINPCQKSPITLYELAARVVESLKFPDAFDWTVEDVADWMEDVVGFPQYKSCILDNHINGRRLLLLEDPSVMPELNIHCFDHIKRITAAVRQTFNVEFVKFTRSIGLPQRLPLTLCTRFKSRTGPSWGIRQNWSRCDILRSMSILKSPPVYRNHWDLVWYKEPDFPKTKFARIPRETICVCKKMKYFVCTCATPVCTCPTRPDIYPVCTCPTRPDIYPVCTCPTRPDIYKDVTSVAQRKPKQLKKKPMKKITIPKPSRLDPPKVILEGKCGHQLLLARRKLPRKKFLEFPGQPAP